MTGPAIYFDAGGLSVRRQLREPGAHGMCLDCRHTAFFSVGGGAYCLLHASEAHSRAIKEAVVRSHRGI